MHYGNSAPNYNYDPRYSNNNNRNSQNNNQNSQNNNKNNNKNNNNKGGNNAKGKGEKRDGICFTSANGQHCYFGVRCHYRHEFPAGYVPAAAPESTTAAGPALASHQPRQNPTPKPQNQGEEKGNTY